MNQMKMFEIDPKLFVTCRLCLDNTGVYQIVPSVQKQIKFCYEIEVDPFDALPQLICRDCESTLRTYFEVKTSYVEKQKNLRQRLQLQNVASHSPAKQPEQETVTSTQVCSEGNRKNRKRIISFHNSSSELSEADCFVFDISKEKRKKKRKRTKDPVLPNIFELGYKKWFACRFCNHQYKYRSEIISHINTHSSMKQKYNNLIKRDCFVKLDKVDNKQNICKSEKYVVHSSDKITHSVHNFYYVIIRPKKYSNNTIKDQGSSVEDKELFNSEGSEDEIKGCKKRRRRILSNDTVVIEKSDFKDSSITKSNASAINDYECISIDDSDNESIKSSDVLSNAGSANLSSSLNNSEYKTIHNIISLCFKRHVERMESIDTIEADIPCHIINKQQKLDSLLKHKVLSVGKKMITNSTFSCTGILRYLEHQNLEIVWTPKMLKYAIKKSDCVIIMMKLKSRDENDGHESGWKILENSKQVNRVSKDYIFSPIENELIQNTDKICCDKSETGSIVENHDYVTECRAETYGDKICSEKDNMFKRLLNENPVSFPKTLPKKTQGPKLSNSRKKRIISKEDKPIDRRNGNTTDNILWPVITSTMSLTSVSDAKKQQTEHNGLPSISSTLTAEQSSDASSIPLTDNATINSEQQEEPIVANFPRIKVKPASQLMSNTALNIMEQQNTQQANIFAQNQNVNMSYSNVDHMEKVTIPGLNNTNSYQNENFNVTSQTLFETNSATSVPTSHENSIREYVVMHSVDLPHTKTITPFGYLKRLLQINNIHLLGPDEIMSSDFICLLKFKLVFQQETTSPVVLCLALFNSKEKFCLKVKDVNDIEINISRLTPNWQWEILKVYSGDVVTKMLINAQKVSSEVFHNTRKFICYLNSIEFQKPL